MTDRRTVDESLEIILTIQELASLVRKVYYSFVM